MKEIGIRKQGRKRMSILNSIKDTYNSIPKQEPVVQNAQPQPEEDKFAKLDFSEVVFNR